MRIVSSPLDPKLTSVTPGEEKKAILEESKRLEQDAQKYAQAEKAAKDFESMFVNMMLKAMRATAKPEDESNAQDIYQGMLDSEYSKAMTDGQNFGVKDMVLDWMKNADPDLKKEMLNRYALDQYRQQDAAVQAASISKVR